LHWTVVAQNVCEKCLVESFVDPFIGKQVLNVEQIPRMLSIQGGNQFPRVEVRKRNNLDFGKAELFLYDGPNCSQLYGWMAPRRTGVTSILIWAFL